MANPYRLLHIADPHFGRAGLDPVQEGRDHAEEITEVLSAQYSLKRKLDCIIFSGDFTCGCKREGFDAAAAFIDGLAPHVCPNGIIVIPGNHDIALGKPVPIGPLSLANPKEESERAFREFLRQIRRHVDDPPNRLLCMVRRIEPSGRPHGLFVVGLNSCRVERCDARGWGYIGLDQIREVFSRLCGDPSALPVASKGDIVLVVAHHNVLPIWDVGLEVLSGVPETRKFSFTMDAAAILKALANIGALLLMHGHTHVRSVKRVEGYGLRELQQSSEFYEPILVLGAGSFGLFPAKASDPPSHFQLIEIEAENLKRMDWESSSKVANRPRSWVMTERLVQHNCFWDPKRAQNELARFEMARKAREAEAAYENSQSWSKLHKHPNLGGNLKKWNEVINEFLKAVQKYEPGVTRTEIVDLVDALFANPPSESELCGFKVEEVLLKRWRKRSIVAKYRM